MGRCHCCCSCAATVADVAASVTCLLLSAPLPRHVQPSLDTSEYTVLPCTHFNTGWGSKAQIECHRGGGLVVQHWVAGKGDPIGHRHMDDLKDFGTINDTERVHLLAQVSEEKGTLVNMGNADSWNIFNISSTSKLGASSL